MSIVNYKRVKCPKCGKSYFKVKENNDFTISLLAFKNKPEPIYKDEELQNPVEAELEKEYCKCLECGCNFRVEFFDFSGEYKFIDEDAETEEFRKKIEKCSTKLAMKRESEEVLEIMDSGNLIVGNSCKDKNRVGISQPEFTSLDSSIKNAYSIDWRDMLKEELDEIKERLERLEKKESL